MSLWQERPPHHFANRTLGLAHGLFRSTETYMVKALCDHRRLYRLPRISQHTVFTRVMNAFVPLKKWSKVGGCSLLCGVNFTKTFSGWAKSKVMQKKCDSLPFAVNMHMLYLQTPFLLHFTHVRFSVLHSSSESLQHACCIWRQKFQPNGLKVRHITVRATTSYEKHNFPFLTQTLSVKLA